MDGEIVRPWTFTDAYPHGFAWQPDHVPWFCGWDEIDREAVAMTQARRRVRANDQEDAREARSLRRERRNRG